MKTIVKITASLFFVGVVSFAFAQQQQTKPAAKKADKKQTNKKNKEVDNKIAVSDQAQPADKGTKASKKDQGGVSNK
jgi:hypothetical protein